MLILGLTYVQSIPLSFREIFHSYFELGSRIRKHYFSASVALCLAYGEAVPPIHRRNLYSLQYSMLPAERVGILELWYQLTGEQPLPSTKRNGLPMSSGLG
jgi:phosphatidylinositol glycan class Q protein